MPTYRSNPLIFSQTTAIIGTMDTEACELTWIQLKFFYRVRYVRWTCLLFSVVMMLYSSFYDVKVTNFTWLGIFSENVFSLMIPRQEWHIAGSRNHNIACAAWFDLCCRISIWCFLLHPYSRFHIINITGICLDVWVLSLTASVWWSFYFLQKRLIGYTIR